MTATILIDNHTNGPLASEWGLSVYIQFDGRTYLLDTGAGPLFAENADALGLDLTSVDCGVLSHAHYDHADGMDTFFARNRTAPFYLRAGSQENCYHKKDGVYEYDGIRKGLLTEFADRIRYVEGTVTLAPNVFLLPHSTPGLEAMGVKGDMYRWEDGRWVPDDFFHEQSLIFSTEDGLVIFNSCCHSGADVVVREAAAAFPGKPIRAIIGGFHLFETPDEEVYAFARRLGETGVEQIVTGHCTGDRAFAILQEVLGAKVKPLESGLKLTF